MTSNWVTGYDENFHSLFYFFINWLKRIMNQADIVGIVQLDEHIRNY